MNVAFKEPAKPVRALDSIAEALLVPSGIDGVYARTAVFEQAVDGLTGLITRYREPNTEVLRFPPVMSRRQVEKSGSAANRQRTSTVCSRSACANMSASARPRRSTHSASAG
jgi:hypothetical protein